MSPTRWVSAIQQLSTSTPKFLPRTGAMLTSRLRLVRPINDGRSANLWLADHLALATRVEVLFAASSAADPAVARNELGMQAQAFHDCAEAAAKINDPHVVLILEQGDVNGVPFMVTKALEGRSMRQRLLHGPVSLAEVQRIVRDAASTLGKAHSLGIAHGHLRPDCLFSTEVGGDAFLEIAGFGDADGMAGSPENPYASPEQLLHATASDVRSDLWSLAVTVYELLTTTLPFEAPTPAGVSLAICNAAFAKPSHYRADLPSGIDVWFEGALAKDPARRFRDAAEFASAFEHALTVQALPPVAPPLPADSLDLDDGDEDEDEKTVKWDMPDDARAIARASLAANSVPPPALARPSSHLTANLAMASKPGSVSTPPRPLGSPSTAPGVPSGLPPALEPGVYLDSPYIASVMSALSVAQPSVSPAAAHQLAQTAPGLEGMLARARHLLGIEGPLFTPEKTWLAALAFAAGVAVTWFAYSPEPDGEPVADGTAADGPIRTVSVDDLPRVEGDDVESLRIIQTNQLPRAVDDTDVPPPPAARAAAPSERRSVSSPAAPSQRVQALAPAPKPASTAARPKTADATTSNCNPPYYFDGQGIRRIKSECLNGSGTIQGPYGAVMTTNVAAKTSSSSGGKGTTEKQARAGASCSPPYYFDGKIKRLKLECL
ncbi:MAG TPA: hypothetical protein VMG12_21040 [Polyangiaceae bacterium]|nr:hypothetical protein [Polyangiaceae bacterium]